MLSKKAKLHFEALYDAAHANELCLVECTDRKTGKPIPVLCSAETIDGVVHLHPLGKLFRGNPYNEVVPPGLDAPKLI